MAFEIDPENEPVNDVAYTFPFTWRVASVGVVVPIPTLPLDVMRTRSVVSVEELAVENTI